MSRFDSVDLVFDTDPLPIVDRGRCWATTAEETGRTVWTARPGFELPEGLGLNGLKDDGNAVGLRLSAKVMGADYLDGFTYATIGNLADRLRGSGFFPGLDADDLLAARVTRADPYLDLPLGDRLPAYVEALHLVTATGGDRLSTKGRRRTPTFYAKRSGDLFDIRQYGKAADLSKAKNRPLTDAHPGLAARAEASGLWRIEGNAVGVGQLRRLAWMDRGAPTFSDVLRAPGTPLADALDDTFTRWAERATRPMPLPSIPNNPAAAVEAFAGLSPREQKAAIYARWICDLADGDLDAARGLLRALHGPKNWHRQLPPVEAELRRRAAETAAQRAPSLRSDPDGPLAAVRSLLADVLGDVRTLERAA